jgi:hypothetical protein
MKNTLLNPLAGLMLVVLVGCATVGGTLVGAGIGAISGDAELGAAVGGTAGLVVDLFGR